jgi:AAA domain
VTIDTAPIDDALRNTQVESPDDEPHRGPGLRQRTEKSFLDLADEFKQKQWADAALSGITEEVSTAPEGTRNDTLNKCAFKAGSRLVEPGHKTEDEVTAALTDAALRAGLDHREIAATIDSGLRAGKEKGPWPNAPHAARDSEDRPRLWQATDLKPAAPQRWLATQRLQQGAINLLIGDEGIGKSLLWVWISAAVTTGKPLPEFGIPAREPAHAIIVATEDDWSTTVRPRLEVAGADLAMIRVICADHDGSGAPVFPDDLFLITNADPKPALVVVDCWLDTVPAALSVRNPQQARLALHPWREAATTTDAAILLLAHTNRVASANARDKYGATGELRKKARLTLFAQQDDEGRLVVGPEKANNTATIRASAFTIASVPHFEKTDDSDGSVPRLEYVGESDLTAREHIAAAYEDDRSERQDCNAAQRWLSEYLTMNPGAKSADAKAGAKKADIAERTLQRARKRLDVVVDYTGMPAVTTWTLPTQEDVPHVLA